MQKDSPINRNSDPVNRLNAPAVCNTGDTACCPGVLSADSNRDHVRDCRHCVYQTALGWQCGSSETACWSSGATGHLRTRQPRTNSVSTPYCSGTGCRCAHACHVCCIHCRPPAARATYHSWRIFLTIDIVVHCPPTTMHTKQADWSIGASTPCDECFNTNLIHNVFPIFRG